MDNVSGENLGWFWKSWFVENYLFDQSVIAVNYENNKASEGAVVTIGNGETIHRDKSHEHFVSRLRRLAFHLKRHAKLSPLIPAGLEPPGGSAG